MCAQCECKRTLLQKHDKNKTKSDKDTYSKLVLNRLKVMWDSTSIYTHQTLSLRMFFKKLPTYMWPMFIHMRINSEL
jgi:hypothetical protein